MVQELIQKLGDAGWGVSTLIAITLVFGAPIIAAFSWFLFGLGIIWGIVFLPVFRELVESLRFKQVEKVALYEWYDWN